MDFSGLDLTFPYAFNEAEEKQARTSHKTEYDEAQKTESEHTDDYGYLNCPEGFRDMLLTKEDMGVTISPGEQIRLAEKLSADTLPGKITKLKTGHHTIAYTTLPEKTKQTFTIEKDRITPLVVPNCKLIVSPEEKVHKIEYLFSVTQKNAATPITGWMAQAFKRCYLNGGKYRVEAFRSKDFPGGKPAFTWDIAVPSKKQSVILLEHNRESKPIQSDWSSESALIKSPFDSAVDKKNHIHLVTKHDRTLVYRIYDGKKWIDMPSVETLPLMRQFEKVQLFLTEDTPFLLCRDAARTPLQLAVYKFIPGEADPHDTSNYDTSNHGTRNHGIWEKFTIDMRPKKAASGELDIRTFDAAVFKDEMLCVAAVLEDNRCILNTFDLNSLERVDQFHITSIDDPHTVAVDDFCDGVWIAVSGAGLKLKQVALTGTREIRSVTVHRTRQVGSVSIKADSKDPDALHMCYAAVITNSIMVKPKSDMLYVKYLNRKKVHKEVLQYSKNIVAPVVFPQRCPIAEHKGYLTVSASIGGRIYLYHNRNGSFSVPHQICFGILPKCHEIENHAVLLAANESGSLARLNLA